MKVKKFKKGTQEYYIVQMNTQSDANAIACLLGIIKFDVDEGCCFVGYKGEPKNLKKGKYYIQTTDGKYRNVISSSKLIDEYALLGDVEINDEVDDVFDVLAQSIVIVDDKSTQPNIPTDKEKKPLPPLPPSPIAISNNITITKEFEELLKVTECNAWNTKKREFYEHLYQWINGLEWDSVAFQELMNVITPTIRQREEELIEMWRKENSK